MWAFVIFFSSGQINEQCFCGFVCIGLKYRNAGQTDTITGIY